VLDPNALTLGFARRFATYKRPTLLLADPDRLVRLLTDPHRPMQLIVAGKAHPQDQAGKALVQAWVQFSRRPEVRGRVAFLSDYDMLLARNLVRGVDVWLNTPRRPWEASGTSGMKVLVNGGLNLSVPDGWWAEAYEPDVGWALGDGLEHPGEDAAAWDAHEADALYTLLEREVAPAFYDRDEEGLPRAWIARMRRSMVRLTPQFSTARMVQEYTERYYLPAARTYRHRVADGGRGALEFLAWREALERYWHELRFGEVRVATADGAHRFEAQVYLGELNPEAVAVELFALSPDGAPPVRQAMARGHPLGGAVGGYAYAAEVPNDRPAADYTPRIVPRHPHAAVPAEARLILWER
jgi:starch phosphorylase